jgi:hypothetical protein
MKIIFDWRCNIFVEIRIPVFRNVRYILSGGAPEANISCQDALRFTGSLLSITRASSAVLDLLAADYSIGGTKRQLVQKCAPGIPMKIMFQIHDFNPILIHHRRELPRQLKLPGSLWRGIFDLYG